MASFRCGTWNARGLFAEAIKIQVRKLLHADGLVRNADFIGIQEVHGSAAVIADHMHKYKDCWHVAWTAYDSPEAASLDLPSIQLGVASAGISSEKIACHSDHNNIFSAAGDAACEGNVNNQGNDIESNDSDSSKYSNSSDNSHNSNNSQSSSVSSSCSAKVGGILNILSKKAFPPGTSTSFSSWTLVQGRCLETIAEFGGCTSVFINIHLFNWTSHDIRAFVERVSLHHNRALNDPLHYFVCILGDMNIRYADQTVLDVATGKAILKEPKHAKPTKQFKQVLDLFTRIEHNQYTHYNHGCRHLNTIDLVSPLRQAVNK